MKQSPEHKLSHGQHHGSLVSYSLGFVISIVFSLFAFGLVESHIFPTSFLVGSILVLAVSQLFVQLVTFLHLGRESAPRWNLIIFLYAGILLLALVIGTLWIMNNLAVNTMMTPTQMDAYMMDQ